MSKKVMLSGYYGFENFGDDLILAVLVQQLKSWGITPLVLSGNPIQTRRHYDVESMPRTEIHKIWKAMEGLDAFISGGGGLFQDSTGPGSPIYYGGLIEMAHWKKIPVAFFGQGVGPIRSWLGRTMTTRAVKNSQLVVVRDVKSQAIIYQLAEIKADIMADPVWLWQPPAGLKTDSAKALGVSLRPWPQLQQKEIQRIAHCIIQLPQIQQAGVNLIDCQSGADIVPLAKLEQILKENRIPCKWFSEENCLQGIAQSSALLGMRYHAILMAAQLGVPIVSVSYDPKVQLLAAQLKLVDFPVTSMEELTAQSFRESLRLPDAEVMDQFRKGATKGFSLLKSWLRV